MLDKNELKIHDIPYAYDADVIHCFERPVATVLNYYNRNYAGLYLMLAKLRGVYMQGDVKQKVMEEFQTLFGIRIIEPKKLTYKELIQAVEQGMPAMVGVNLKEIFYSDYYKTGNWGHWMLIKGYKTIGDLVTVYDNTQYGNVGHEYGNFHLPFPMLQKANDSYKKAIGKEYSFMVFKQERKVEVLSILIYILEAFQTINVQEVCTYKQFELFSTLNELYRNESLHQSGVDTNYYSNELKKKLINVNKYRKLFHEQIKAYMQTYDFDETQMEVFYQTALELQELWEVFVMKKTLEIARGRLKAELLNEIIEKEQALQHIAGEFLNYLKTTELEKKEIKSKKETKTFHAFENNEDNIITETETEIIFDFKGNRTYNWWEQDEAPKVILASAFSESQFCYETELVIDEAANSHNFEAGFFLRNKNTGESILLGIENQENIVFDETNITGHKIHVEKKARYQLFLRYQNGELISGVDGKEYFHHECDGVEQMQFGLVCKTWGTGGALRVTFRPK